MVAWALDQHIPDSGMKLLLISLANAHNGKTGQCNPGFEQLCKETSLSRSTVIRKLKSLEDDGWITSHPNFTESGRQTSNTYAIVTSREGVNLTPAEGSTMKPSRGSQADTLGGVNGGTPYEPEKGTYTPQPPLQGGSDDLFGKMKAVWPADKLGDLQAAERVWSKLDAGERQKAEACAKTFVNAMRLRKDRVPRLSSYLGERRFVDFYEAPPIDRDGEFVITPDRPEWGPWLGAVRKQFGEKGVNVAVRQKLIVRKQRWPDGAQPPSSA